MNKDQECKKYCAKKLDGRTKKLDGRTKKLDGGTKKLDGATIKSHGGTKKSHGAILISIVIIIMIDVMNGKMDGLNIISIVRIENIDYSFKLLIKLVYMIN